MKRKTALITGACINTGVAIVERFASDGYDVVFTGRNCESVAHAEAAYKEKFSDVKIIGYCIDSHNEKGYFDDKEQRATCVRLIDYEQPMQSIKAA